MLAVEVVLPDGTLTMLGGEDPEPAGYDLRGVFVGSEGMLGIATAVCVKLTQNPPAVRTLLMDFDSVEDGAETVSGIIAAGMVPAAVEMMDQLCLQAVEAYINAGLPVDAAAALLVEVVGLRARRRRRRRADRRDRPCAIGVRTMRIAQDDAERALLWKGRKSAFGAIARIKPNYYLHDTVVPRSKLPEVLDRGLRDRRPPRAAGAQRVPRRRRQPPPAARVRRPRARRGGARPSGRRRDRARVGRGGRSAERRARHRPREARLHVADVLRRPTSPPRTRCAPRSIRIGCANPGKVLPSPATCGDIQSVPAGAWV